MLNHRLLVCCFLKFYNVKHEQKTQDVCWWPICVQCFFNTCPCGSWEPCGGVCVVGCVWAVGAVGAVGIVECVGAVGDSRWWLQPLAHGIFIALSAMGTVDAVGAVYGTLKLVCQGFHWFSKISVDSRVGNYIISLMWDFRVLMDSFGFWWILVRVLWNSLMRNLMDFDGFFDGFLMDFWWILMDLMDFWWIWWISWWILMDFGWVLMDFGHANSYALVWPETLTPALVNQIPKSVQNPKPALSELLFSLAQAIQGCKRMCNLTLLRWTRKPYLH